MLLSSTLAVPSSIELSLGCAEEEGASLGRLSPSRFILCFILMWQGEGRVGAGYGRNDGRCQNLDVLLEE